MRDRRTVQSHPETKRSKPANLRVGGQKGRACGKCDNVHEGPYRSRMACYIYIKDGILATDCPWISGRLQLYPEGSFES